MTAPRVKLACKRQAFNDWLWMRRVLPANVWLQCGWGGTSGTSVASGLVAVVTRGSQGLECASWGSGNTRGENAQKWVFLVNLGGEC